MSANPIADRLLDANVPVVVCRPNPKWFPGCDEGDVLPPKGWNRVTAEQARPRLDRFRPGIDALAMVGGHGIDVLDVDVKDGARLGDVPPELTGYGLTITPSAGGHFPVPSTGYGKGTLRIGGKHIGDYVGGTVHRSGRLLAFLPGSTRRKYPNSGYTEVNEWDIERLTADSPSDLLIDILEASGLSPEGTPPNEAAASAAVLEFLEDNHDNGRCGWGRATLRFVAQSVRDVVPKDPQRGRHNWTVAKTCKVVELIKAGCLDSSALDTVRGCLAKLKPEGGTDFNSVLAWAVANTEPKTGCSLHSLVLRAWLDEVGR